MITRSLEIMLLEALQSLGFRKVFGSIYELLNEPADVRHLLRVTTSKSLAHRVSTCEYCMRNDVAENFAIRTLERYGGELYLKAVRRHQIWDCFLSFDFGALPPEDMLFIHKINAPMLSERDVVDWVASRVRQGFMPLVEKSRTMGGLLDLLVSDREGVQWFRTNPIIRVALIISLSHQIGLGEEETLEPLRAIERYRFAKPVPNVGSLRDFGGKLLSDLKNE